jgi:hypothetical protein
MRMLIIGIWMLLALAAFWLVVDVMDQAWMVYFKHQTKETQEMLISKIEASGVDATVLKLMVENEK